MQVPLLDLKGQYQTFKEDVMKEVAEIAESQYFILGPKVEKFEKECAEYCGAKYGVGVTSGSDALIIALMVEEIGAGDEVITTPFTFFATGGAIARVGATPVFVDVDEKTFNIDPEKIREKITEKTKAIIPVHLFGQCCDMDPIMEMAKENDLIVIEDSAQSIGSEYKGRRSGSMADYGCFSFFPSKNLGCFGDGGMVTTNDPEKAKLLKIFRNHGSDPKYYHKFIGGNFRLDALQAAILSIKLPLLDSWSDARQVNASEYYELFANSSVADKVVVPSVAEFTTRHIYNQFSIIIKDGKRDAVVQALRDAEVGCDIYYPLCLHEQECFQYLGYKRGDIPVAESIADSVLAIPIFPESTSEMRKFVVETIEKALA